MKLNPLMIAMSGTGLMLGAMAMPVSATQLPSPAQVTVHAYDPCEPTMIEACSDDDYAGMYLVVDDGTGVQSAHIGASGSYCAEVSVGPYYTMPGAAPALHPVMWRVSGGGERDWDIPLWNGYYNGNLGDPLGQYVTANGDGWVNNGGASDPNPFTTWRTLSVPRCMVTKDLCKYPEFLMMQGFRNKGDCVESAGVVYDVD